MSFIYISHGFSIYPHLQVIKQGEQSIQVRPKTFALLLLLLENPREILSKRTLLDSIWDDVNVDEPVLVQSIRELRQLFGSADIIQTYPRKGYAWSASVQKQLLPTHTPVHSPAKALSNRPYAFLLAGVSLVIILLIAALYTSAKKTADVTTTTDVVIVLPVKNNIAGIDHHWVPLGAMDQLIHSLIPDQRVQVLNTEYVLSLMKLAEIPRDYQSVQVPRLFDLSGASLIVESQLSGFVEDYRLEYKFRSRHAVKRGVIFAKNLNDLLQQLSSAIATQTDQALNIIDLDAHTAFNNELMARALEKIETNEFEIARTLLTSLKLLEPNQVMVRQTLAQLFITLDEPQQAQLEINAALKIATREQSARLLFLLALAQSKQELLNDALVTLGSANQQAKYNNDILYQAYIAQLRGLIEQKRAHFNEAQIAFEQAMSLHTIIHCPIGISLTHLQLAELSSAQGLTDIAGNHYAEAKRLIKNHQLTQLFPQLEVAVAPQIQD